MFTEASFRNPDHIDGFIGYIRIPSLHSEAGYLYFDWLDFQDIDSKWYIKRWFKNANERTALAKKMGAKTEFSAPCCSILQIESGINVRSNQHDCSSKRFVRIIWLRYTF